MSLTPFLSSVIDWLRAGYPNGVPEQDYVPLLALLGRRLTDAEIAQVAEALFERGELPIDKADIGVLITKVTDEMPLETDIDRVRGHLDVVRPTVRWESHRPPREAPGDA